MVIRDIAHSITTLSVPFSLLGGRAKTGGRATIVRLGTGSLAVFSPVALTSAVHQKLNSLGSVRYIVALNVGHHLSLTEWATAFPQAEVIGMEGLPEKREKSKATKGTRFSRVFTAENRGALRISPEFDDEFEYEYMPASANKEIVFFHKPTRTMIQADLLLNLPATEQYSKVPGGHEAGFLGKVLGGVFNTQGDMLWQKRALWYGVGSKNRPAFAESLKTILSWDFDRIIPCHGDVIETGGTYKLEQLADWFLHGKR